MPLTDYTDYITKLNTSGYRMFTGKGAAANAVPSNGNNGLWYSTFLATPDGAAIPSASVTLNNSSLGQALYPRIPDSLSVELILAMLENFGQRTGSTSDQRGTDILLIDRLAHSGGLSGIVTTAQTTNLPTAALTRNTGGVGNKIALQIYTALGTTATTAVASYTNQDGVAGRTTKEINIGSAVRNSPGLFASFPLQDGDTGVQSVQSVTLAGTTGTAGNFGVVIFRPIFAFTFDAQRLNYIQPFGAFPRIHQDACVDLLVSGWYATNSVLPRFSLIAIENR